MRFIRAIFLVSLLALAVTASGLPQDKAALAEKSKGAPSAQADGDYVGTDTCRGCHEDIGKNFDTNPHRKTLLDKTADAAHQGCEACHGPGAAHVEGGGDKSKIFSFKGKTTKEASTRCLECHGQSDEHGGFLRSKHARQDVGCAACHSIHKPASPTRLLAEKTPQLCYTCHNDVKAEFLRPSHHRVNEGLISCMDCHNPHGEVVPRQLRFAASNDQVCYKCHSDKLGPFVFEHPPVKADGCTACHTPHSSTTQRMLKRASVNVMCLECHSATVTQRAQAPQILDPTPAGPAHNQQQGRFQSCTLCHQFIHGSNSSAVFFKP